MNDTPSDEYVVTPLSTASLSQLVYRSGRSPVAHSFSRGACERCYTYKKQCRYGHNQSSCSGCNVLGRVCRERTRKRLGRKPKVAQFPSGTFSVLNLEPKVSSRISPSELCHSELRPAPNPSKSSPYIQSFLTSRGSKSQLLKAGRSPEPLSTYTPTCLSDSDQQIRQVLWTKEGFFSGHRPFMLGKSFADDFHTTVLLLFNQSPHILADGYRAILKLMNSRNQAIDDSQPDVSLGTVCLRSFTTISSSVANENEAAVLLMLGQLLLAYNALLWLGSTRTLTHGILLAVKHWYPAMLQRPELDCVTITPILIDTVDCLIRRNIPIVRFPETERCIVSREMGVCSSLLPLLYDLCERSYQLKITSPEYPTVIIGRNSENPYADIEERIRNWSPNYPPDYSLKYMSSEVAAMSTIACTYRLAALLIIHRLQFPLGVEDSVDKIYAESILDELSLLSWWPSDGATGLGLDFPLLVATVELPSRGARLSNVYEPMRYCKRQSGDIMTFARRVKEAQDVGFRGLWFDLVEDQYPGDILP
jgi:hypothetical protein